MWVAPRSGRRTSFSSGSMALSRTSCSENTSPRTRHCSIVSLTRRFIMRLRLYLSPVAGTHEAGEVTRVAGSYDHALHFFCQIRRLRGEDDVYVQPFRRGRAIPACVRRPRAALLAA